MNKDPLVDNKNQICVQESYDLIRALRYEWNNFQKKTLFHRDPGHHCLLIDSHSLLSGTNQLPLPLKIH